MAALFVLLLLLLVTARAQLHPGESPPPLTMSCLPRDFTPVVLPTQCGPMYSRPQDECNQYIRKCFCQHGIEMKWTGRGCGKIGDPPLGDGGCQCADYCGWECQDRCVNEPLKRCYWTDGIGCRNKYTGLGGPMITCFAPSAAPSLAPTDAPSDAPSSSPSKVPTTSLPSSSPSANPTTSQPSASPSAAPSLAPSTSGPSAGPTTSAPTSSPTQCDAEQTGVTPPGAHQCEVAPRCGSSAGCGCVAGGHCLVQDRQRCQVNATEPREFCCSPGDAHCISALQTAGLPYQPECPSGTLCAPDCCSEVGAMSCLPVCYSG